MNKFLTLAFGVVAGVSSAAEPADYYKSCEGLTDKVLLQQLCEVVGPHHNVGYDGLWNVYKISDVRADGTLWDIYSTKAWPASFPKCGNYSRVGDCVNREHSFPKSWWGGGKAAQYSDAYHLYPTDGKVNGQRSNFPYGECANGSTLAPSGSVKALGKLGTSTFPGYSGTVFEPDNEYKGDLARTYFYMAAAYNDKISGWHSEMLAGNNYPVYKSWSVDLLLKWHRQDPVSDKELNRNEAVSKHQNNRNPFIDHPELAEYIWGNKKGQAWYAGAATEPEIIAPVNGSEIDLGVTSTGHSRSRSVSVRAMGLTENITVSVSGKGFSVSPSTLDFKTACSASGASVTVSYTSAEAQDAAGTLTLVSGKVSSAATLRAAAVDGLPAGPATDISDVSFTARWSCIDEPSTKYVLNVMRNGASVAGYPVQVTAGDEQAQVAGLEPETTYTYTVASPTLISDAVTVTTMAPMPSVDFFFDGTLEFVTLPGVPSDIAEILVDIVNIPGDVTITVASPFQVSADKSSWDTSVVLSPGMDRFYMRLYGSVEGAYTTSLVATADGGYVNDDIDVNGTIGTPPATFHEDFEPRGEGSYSDKEYLGSAARWKTDAYFGTGTDNYPHDGNQAARMNKSNPGYLMMLEDKHDGVGTLSLWARLWKSDTKTVTITVSVSTDSGATWNKSGEIKVVPNGNGGNNSYAEYSLTINMEGDVRVKLEQDIVSRTMIDDIRMNDYTKTSSIEQACKVEYHKWDAYCRNGRLILESAGADAALNGDGDFATVYSVDGIERYAALLPAGETSVSLAPGLYIVVVRDFSRRVLVK